VVAVDAGYLRPTEVDSLLGDATKARQRLGWQPRTQFVTLVREMMELTVSAAKREQLVRDSGL